MLPFSWNRQTMLDTRSHAEPNSCRTTSTSFRRRQTPAEELRPSSPIAFSPLPSPKKPPRGSPQRPQASSDEAAAESENNAPAQWDVADVLREAEPRAEQLLVDEYIVAVPEETSVQRSGEAPTIPFSPRPSRNETRSRRRMQPFDEYASA